MLGQCPLHMLANKCARVLFALVKSGYDCRGSRGIAERHSNVAQPLFMGNSPNGRAAREIVEFQFREAK